MLASVLRGSMLPAMARLHPSKRALRAGAIRGVANRVFAHLHGMDLAFHLGRQTGGLARVIDRGTRGINFILRCAHRCGSRALRALHVLWKPSCGFAVPGCSSMVFNVLPTALEVVMVAGILAYR